MFRKRENVAEVSPERALNLRQTQRRRFFVNLTRIGILAALFGLWEIAGNLGWIDSFIMSQPSRILKSLTNLYENGDLLRHIGISCLETIIGFLLGTIIGTLIATALWWSSFLSRVMEPYLVILNALPKVALGPIFIVWVGAGPKAIIIMTLAISLIVTIMEVLSGFMATEEEKIKLMRVYGANKLQIFTKAVLPSNFITIINSLKINVGLSWVGVIMGEFLVSKAGVGYLIVYGSQVFKMDLVMTSVLLLAVAAALMYQVVLLLERKIIKNKV